MMIVIANVFPKLQTVKHLIKPLSWKRHFRTSFDSQHVNGCQTLVKSAWEHFYHIFWSPWAEMIRKVSSFFNFEILRVFISTLTADDKYPLQDCENFQFIIQMQLYLKRELFLSFLCYLWDLHEILNIFQKKMIAIGNVFPKLQTVKELIEKLSWKCRFRTSFDI